MMHVLGVERENDRSDTQDDAMRFGSFLISKKAGR